VRFDDLRGPESIPRETDFAGVIESNPSIVVEHARLDARPQPMHPMSTTAYAAS
jgi:hypothetical protein